MEFYCRHTWVHGRANSTGPCRILYLDLYAAWVMMYCKFQGKPKHTSYSGMSLKTPLVLLTLPRVSMMPMKHNFQCLEHIDSVSKYFTCGLPLLFYIIPSFSPL